METASSQLILKVFEKTLKALGRAASSFLDVARRQLGRPKIYLNIFISLCQFYLCAESKINYVMLVYKASDHLSLLATVGKNLTSISGGGGACSKISYRC